MPPLGVDSRKVYMRNFMAVKRERERRLVEIANMLRSEDDRIQGLVRMEFEAFARDEMRKPLHQRAPQGFKFKIQARKK